MSSFKPIRPGVKAHSLRSASSSAAYEARVALPDIMEAADWSTVSTFTKFYHKPVCKSSFANAVLGQTDLTFPFPYPPVHRLKLNRGHWQFLVKSRRHWTQHIKVKYRDNR